MQILVAVMRTDVSSCLPVAPGTRTLWVDSAVRAQVEDPDIVREALEVLLNITAVRKRTAVRPAAPISSAQRSLPALSGTRLALLHQIDQRARACPTH